jgi:hypothetical protein
MAKSTSRRPVRKGAEQTPAPASAPTWQHVFAELASLWSFSLAEQSAADRDAWRLLWAGAKHFGAPIDHHGEVTEERILRAADVLRGGKGDSASLKRATDRARLLDAGRSVDAALAVPGPADGYVGLSKALCEHFQSPEKGAPVLDPAVLANMLAHVIPDRGKQGQPPRGQYTRKMIREWLTGLRERTKK